jgi:sugar lactone lactonase YvrE
MHSHGRDHSIGRQTRPAWFGVAAALVMSVLAGCGGADADSCVTAAGEGMLMLTIVGHDPGAVTVEGNVGVLEGDTILTLPAGPHAITAARVTSPQTGITSQVFEGTVDRPEGCVRAGATTAATVTYKLVPTSGKLWVGVGNAPDDSTMLGFTPASLAATRTSVADVAANTGGSDGFTFDQAGNIWVLGGTTADPPLARYPAALFASDGLKVPDVTIESSSFGSSIPGPKVVAFDPAGNLWVSVVAEDKVVMFTAAQVSAGGRPTATVERRGLISPQGLAFDSAGNLWVVAHDEDKVVRIDKDHLTTSGDSEDLAIMAETPLPVVIGLTPISLAFDAAGTLWVNYDGTIAAIPVADQQGTGTKMITPAIQITTDVLTLPVGMAFDQDGGLWVAYAAGQFARFDSTQLGASGAVAPSTIISSPDVGYASWFAVYPAPAFTPLYHKVP